MKDHKASDLSPTVGFPTLRGENELQARVTPDMNEIFNAILTSRQKREFEAIQRNTALIWEIRSLPC